ncbi:MAG: hypothetical protein JWM28_970, partial [Chitinophagaceae bacterium]|nr:hypothetical protein [Chitinophagaceae bacterium]
MLRNQTKTGLPVLPEAHPDQTPA